MGSVFLANGVDPRSSPGWHVGPENASCVCPVHLANVYWLQRISPKPPATKRDGSFCTWHLLCSSLLCPPCASCFFPRTNWHVQLLKADPILSFADKFRGNNVFFRIGWWCAVIQCFWHSTKQCVHIHVSFCHYFYYMCLEIFWIEIVENYLI